MAATITGTFLLIDRASDTLKKIERQALKTQAAVEGVGAALDKHTKQADAAAKATQRNEQAQRGLQGRLRQMRDHVTGVTRAHEQHADAVSSSAAVHEDATQKMQRLRYMYLYFKDAVENAKQSIAGHTESVAQHTTTVAQHTDAVAKAAAAHVEHAAATKDVSAGVRTASKDVSAATDSFTGFGGIIGTVSNKVETLSNLMGLLKFGGIGTGIAVLAQGIGQLAGGLTALIPQVMQAGAAIAALPQLATAAGQAFGVFAVTFSGVMKAIQAGFSMQNSSMQDQINYQDQLVQMQNGLIDSSHALQVAQRNEYEQQINLTIARRDAARQLQDLEFQAKSAALAEKSATLSLQEAKYQLAQGLVSPGTTMLQLQQLRLGVQEAQLNVSHQRTMSQRASADARRAVSRDPTSQPARTLAQAQIALSDAAWSVNSAQRSLNLQMMQYQRLLTLGTAAQQAFNQAMRLLPPSAQAFVRQVLSLRGAFNQLQGAAAPGIFNALSASLSVMSSRYLPMLVAGFRSTGNVLGGIITQTTGTFLKRQADFGAIWNDNNRIIGEAGTGANNLLNALFDLMRAAQPFTDWLAGALTGLTKHIANMAAAGRASGGIASYLDKTKAALEQFGRILSNVWHTFTNVMRAAEPLGRKLWQGVEDGTRRWREWTSSPQGMNAMTSWFNKLYPGLHAMGQLVKDLAVAWARITVNPSFAQTITNLTHAVGPIQSLFTTFGNLGPAAATFLSQLARTIADMPVSPVQLILAALDRLLKIIDWMIKNLPGFKLLLDGLIVAATINKIATFAGKVSLLAKAWEAVKVAALGAGAAQEAGMVTQGVASLVPEGGMLGGLLAKLGIGRAASAATGVAEAKGGAAVADAALAGGGGAASAASTAESTLGLGARFARGGIIGAGIGIGGGLLGNAIGGDTGKTIGAAATGAGVGATIGSVIPGVGTILGGVAGAGVGALLHLASLPDPMTQWVTNSRKLAATYANDNNFVGLSYIANQAERAARNGGDAADQLRRLAQQARAAMAAVQVRLFSNTWLPAFQFQLSRVHKATPTMLRDITHELQRLPPAARKDAGQMIKDMANTMAREHKIPQSAAKRISDQVDAELANTKKAQDAGRAKAQAYADAIGKALIGNGKQSAFPGIPSLDVITAALQHSPTAGQAPTGAQGTPHVRPSSTLNPGTMLPARRWGGMIYAQGGTLVPGGFGGGDRVHAMLEPGEFVMRKEAVQAYGHSSLAAMNRAAGRATGPRGTAADQTAAGGVNMLGHVGTLMTQGQARLRRGTATWAAETRRGMANVKKPVTDFHRDAINTLVDVDNRVQKDQRSTWRQMADNTTSTWQNIQKTISQNVQKAESDVSTSFSKIQQDAITALRAMGYTQAQAADYVKGGAKSSGQARAAHGRRVPGLGLQDGVAITAPGELVVNRHTEDRVNRMLAMHGTSLGQQVTGETRPHGEPRRLQGGGYVNPYRHSSGFSPGRIDEGFDAVVSGEIDAIGAGVVTYAGGPAGWPGIGAVVYRLSGGGDAGRYVYLAENIRPTVRTGQHVGAGQSIANAIAAYPYTEMGWASGPNWASGTQTLAKATSGYTEGQATQAGQDFAATLHLAGVAGASGHIIPGLGGGGSLSLTPRRSTVGGAPGAAANAAIQAYTQGLVDTVNQKLPATTGATGGGGAIGGNWSGTWTQIMAQIAAQKHWSLADWKWIVNAESGGNPEIVNASSGAFGLGQFLGGTLQAYARYGAASHDPSKQIVAMAQYISDRYHNPTAAKAFHIANNWYATGGRVPGWGGWNAAGGSFTVDRPTLFGAGEAGRERVTIGPDRGNATGGHTIHVSIGEVHMHRKGDLKNAIREELDDLANELERRP